MQFCLDFFIKEVQGMFAFMVAGGIILAIVYFCVWFKETVKKKFYSYFSENREGTFQINSKVFSTETLKRFWSLIFFVVSLYVCVFYVPYEYMQTKNVWIPMGNADIFNPPKGEQYKNKPARIIYEELVFREFIILSACGAGYIISSMATRKK